MRKQRRPRHTVRSDRRDDGATIGRHDHRAMRHDLHVFQEELKVQNEELMRAQHALEETRDRFVELYDFAPNGYLTLDRNGLILEINLTGASLFGRQRTAIEGRPLMTFLKAADRPTFLEFMRRCRTFKGTTGVECNVTVQTADGARHVYLLSKSRTNARTAAREFLTALIDTTEVRRLEADHQRVALENTALASRLISVQEEERHRIARDLHDNIGQRATVLRLKLEAARAATDPSVVRASIDQAQEVLTQLNRELDYMATELRPAVLDLGVVSAMAQFVEAWSRTFDIAAEFHAVGLDGIRLVADVETQVYRIVQEALHNVYKHAAARHVGVVLERRDAGVVLIVEDDGCGFTNTAADSKPSEGLGLISMRERANLVGGALEIESKPGQGTTVFLTLPHAFRSLGGGAQTAKSERPDARPQSARPQTAQLAATARRR